MQPYPLQRQQQYYFLSARAPLTEKLKLQH
jgi:hypothetical protein